MSKVVNEATAKCFQRRTGADIYGIRINNVIEPHEYEENFGSYFENPECRRRNIFAYIDARDLGEMVHQVLSRGSSTAVHVPTNGTPTDPPPKSKHPPTALPPPPTSAS